MKEKQTINGLPKDWKNVKMGEIFTIERGGSPRPIDEFITDKSDGINWIKIGDTKGVNKYITETKEKIKPAGVTRSRMVYDGDFILSNSMSFGRPYIMRTSGCIHDGWLVIRQNENIDNDFLYYILSSNGVYQQFTKLAKGSTVKNLNIEAVKQVDLVIPPKAVQQQIVSKIEELFSELDKSIEELKTAQQQLKVYRQAVLKWAFEGKLTNEDVKDGELPAGWRMTPVDDFKFNEPGSIAAGPFGTIFKAKDFRSSGIPIIFLRHVKAGHYNTRKPGFMDEHVWKELFQSYSVFGGELLITKLGEPPGECAIYPYGLGPAMVTPDVIKMKVNTDLMLPRYLMYYFNSEISRKALEDIAFGTTRLRITLPIFKKLPIPYCTKEEQQQIVQEIESRLSVCDKVEETINSSLKHAEALRQSILKKAFEGKLIEMLQSQNYENQIP
jgi:type I restriction enzyme, S subunit